MKNYVITLELLTPVFIGSGKEILKKDFELKDGYAYVYDPIKLHSLFGRQYEEFLFDYWTNLTDFIQGNRQRADIDREKALKYKVKCGDSSISKSDSINGFIKDPYGYPYIPGSSLKGALRTVILAHIIKEDKTNRFNRYKNERLTKYSNARDIERAVFGEISEDKFKHFKISDSEPVSKDDLILSKKIDIFKDGESNNKLNLCRESLKPGTMVRFTLTIDKPYYETIFSKENIVGSIKSFSKEYKKVYLSKFKSFNENQYGDDILYLGGGVGFLTKTVNHALYEDNALKNIALFFDERFSKHKHKKDLELGVSPRAKKCTLVDGTTMEMGICSVRID